MIGSAPGGGTSNQVALHAQQIDPAGAVAQRDHLRRCTFRRLTVVRRRPSPAYMVDCLYIDRSVPIPLGDLATARGICDTCVASHVFRPDED